MITRNSVPAFAQSTFEKFAQSDRYKNKIIEDFIDQQGEHPSNWRDFETAFAADALQDYSTTNSRVLDVGSNHLFIAGLCATRKVTTVDVRPRKITPNNEFVVVADAKQIPLPDQSFDVVLSLNAIEHFGLGRYGDPIDIDADFHAAREWKRLLAGGGIMIVSTTISSLGDALAFNAHRIYSYQTIRALFSGLMPLRESVYSNRSKRRSTLAELETPEFAWDLYVGVYQRSDA